MNLPEILRSLKSVEPGHEYTLRSRATILNVISNTAPSAVPWYRTVFATSRTLSRSPAMALALLVLAIAGSFGFGRLFAFRPASSPLASIDTSSIEAEAQAVDIQIQLQNLTVAELQQHGISLPTVQKLSATASSTAASPSTSTTASASTSASSSAGTGLPFNAAMAPTSSVTNTAIDKALHELAN